MMPLVVGTNRVSVEDTDVLYSDLLGFHYASPGAGNRGVDRELSQVPELDKSQQELCRREEVTGFS